MKNLSLTDPLMEAMLRRTRLPWFVATGLFAALLVAGLLCAAYLGNKGLNGLSWDFWRTGLQTPTLIVYILVVYPFAAGMLNGAITAAKQLRSKDTAASQRLISAYLKADRKFEWMALLAGGMFYILLGEPWKMDFHPFEIYQEIAGIVLFALLAGLIHSGIRSARYLTGLIRHVDLDVFDTDALAPIARWSLAVSLAFVGGIMISIVFQSTVNLLQWQTILIYSLLVGATVVIFFTSLFSTHQAISALKKRELRLVTEKLASATRDLKRSAEGSPVVEARELYYAVTAWALYERRIRETREWPLNAGIVSRLVVSAFSPALIYLIKIILGVSQ